MDANQIRQFNWKINESHSQATVYVLIEIAAQLAELNENIKEANKQSIFEKTFGTPFGK